MSEREPSLLRGPGEGPGPGEDLRLDPAAGSPPSPSPAAAPALAEAAAPAAAAPVAPAAALARGASRQVTTVHVVGFWRRAAAAAVDLAGVIPLAMLVVLAAGKLTGVTLPQRVGLLDVDMWIDLVLATDPALVMGGALLFGVGLLYLLVCHVALGRTLGMRLLRIRIIDVYGDPPSPARSLARCAGYLAGAATLFLGFLWMGFDSEKRGLQDWIAGTYVIRA